MKTLQKITGAMLGLIVMTAALAAQPAYTLRVDGLACPFCAYGLEKKLSAIQGVQRTRVDIASGTVSVMMAEGATLDEASAKKAVKDAGFTLRGFVQAQTPPPSQPKK